MADKIYCGSGRVFGKYGQMSLNICLSDIPEAHITEYNGKKYIKLKVSSKKEVDSRGNSHYVEVDTWKPQAQQPQQSQDSGWGGQSNLPF